MAVCVWKQCLRKASVIAKTFMSSNTTSFKFNSAYYKSLWLLRPNSPWMFGKLGHPRIAKFSSSPLHLNFSSNISLSHSNIVFQTDDSFDKKFNEPKHHLGLIFISILAFWGVKVFSSIPVLLADDINSEENNSTRQHFKADETHQDEASGEVVSNLVQNDSTFSQVFPEDLLITDPIEISDVHSLKQSYVVREAAGQSAEAALVLLIRACRALLAAIEDYRASLHHLLDLLSYSAELQRGAACGPMLQQVTQAMVQAKATTNNSKKRLTEVELVVRVSAQALDSLSLCCLLAGSEATALASTAAVTSLQSQVEAAMAEVRQLQAEALARQADLIILEGEGEEEERLEEGEEERLEEGDTNDKN